LGCIGPFVGARAAEFGVDLDRVAIIGHSMGGPAGSNLAFRSFQVTTDADCLESGENPEAAAFLGIGGSYGWAALPIEDDPDSYLSSTKGDEPQREVSATDEVAPGLTAEQAYELDGFSSMELAADDLRVVLLVGTLDPFLATNPSRTRGFAAALEAQGIDVRVIEVEGAGHEDVIYPYTRAGTATLDVISELLDNLGT